MSEAEYIKITMNMNEVTTPFSGRIQKNPNEFQIVQVEFRNVQMNFRYISSDLQLGKLKENVLATQAFANSENISEPQTGIEPATF